MWTLLAVAAAVPLAAREPARRAPRGRRDGSRLDPRPRLGTAGGRAPTMARVLPRRRRTRVLLALLAAGPRRRGGRRDRRLPRRDRRSGQRLEPRGRVRRAPAPPKEPEAGRPLAVAAVRLLEGPPALLQDAEAAADPRAVGARCGATARRALLEFPPVIYRGSIYQLADNGVLCSLRKNTGRHALAAATSATSRRPRPPSAAAALYVTLLERRRGLKQGRVVDLRSTTARTKWSRDLDSRSESSPLLHRGRIYFGTEGGTLYCLNAHNGRTIWRYQADGAIKGSPTLSNGKLFFGDYAGHVHAVQPSERRARCGRRRRRHARSAAGASTRPRRSRSAASTSAAPTGASTRCRPATASLAWARQTGRYVYSSAAVATSRRASARRSSSAPTTATSTRSTREDRRRALALPLGRADLAAPRRSSTGPSSSPTSARETTYGLSLATGKLFFKRKPGAFDPMISDGRHLFQTGRSSLTALLPQKRGRARRRASRRESAAASARGRSGGEGAPREAARAPPRSAASGASAPPPAATPAPAGRSCRASATRRAARRAAATAPSASTSPPATAAAPPSAPGRPECRRRPRRRRAARPRAPRARRRGRCALGSSSVAGWWV